MQRIQYTRGPALVRYLVPYGAGGHSSAVPFSVGVQFSAVTFSVGVQFCAVPVSAEPLFTAVKIVCLVLDKLLLPDLAALTMPRTRNLARSVLRADTMLIRKVVFVSFRVTYTFEIVLQHQCLFFCSCFFYPPADGEK